MSCAVAEMQLTAISNNGRIALIGRIVGLFLVYPVASQSKVKRLIKLLGLLRFTFVVNLLSQYWSDFTVELFVALAASNSYRVSHPNLWFNFVESEMGISVDVFD